MWSLGCVVSFIANKGDHLFQSEQQVRDWTCGSSLNHDIYSIDLRALIANLLRPTTPERRPTAERVKNESRKDNRQQSDEEHDYNL